MGDMTTKQEKLLNSFKKGFTKIKDLSFKALTEDKMIKYTIGKEEIKISLPVGVVVLDCDDVLLSNWIKLVDMVDREYVKDGNSEFIKGIDKFLN